LEPYGVLESSCILNATRGTREEKNKLGFLTEEKVRVVFATKRPLRRGSSGRFYKAGSVRTHRALQREVPRDRRQEKIIRDNATRASGGLTNTQQDGIKRMHQDNKIKKKQGKKLALWNAHVRFERKRRPLPQKGVGEKNGEAPRNRHYRDSF